MWLVLLWNETRNAMAISIMWSAIMFYFTVPPPTPFCFEFNNKEGNDQRKSEIQMCCTLQIELWLKLFGREKPVAGDARVWRWFMNGHNQSRRFDLDTEHWACLSWSANCVFFMAAQNMYVYVKSVFSAHFYSNRLPCPAQNALAFLHFFEGILFRN